MTNSIAAIFDLDGVVVDTVESLYKIYTGILGGFGHRGSREEFNRLNGCNLDEIVSFLAKQYGLLGREDEIRELFVSKFGSLYTEIQLMSGIVPTLEVLKKHKVKIGLASASSRNNIHEVLNKFNLQAFFDFIVSGDDVVRAKPCPDIYNLARERSKCKDCYAIEDSSNGLQAARKAGMITIYFNPAHESIVERFSYSITHVSEIEKIILEDKTIIISTGAPIEIKQDSNQFEISAQEESRVHEIWNEAIQKNPSLFNGHVASYRGHSFLPNGNLEISCTISEYKYLFAQLCDSPETLTPSMAFSGHTPHRGDSRLRLGSQIGVSGVVIDNNKKILLGKRSEKVTEYKGYYELVPSGGITAQNMIGTLYFEQIMTELIEETGIAPQNVKDVRAFCFIYDKIHGVFDIGVKLILSCPIDLATLTSEEYTTFVLLDNDSLRDFMGRERIVPTSEAMFRAMMNEGDNELF